MNEWLNFWTINNSNISIKMHAKSVGQSISKEAEFLWQKLLHKKLAIKQNTEIQ